MANEEEIKKEIKEIEKIEGSEGLMGGYWQVRYLVWQAQREGEKSQQADKQAKDSHSEADRLSSLKTSEVSQQRAAGPTNRGSSAHQSTDVSPRGLVAHSSGPGPESGGAGAAPQKSAWMRRSRRHRGRKSRRGSSIPISGLSN